MLLHYLAIVVPPKQACALSMYQSPICHHGSKFCLALQVLRWLDVVEGAIPFPSRKVLVAVDRASGHGEVCNRTKRAGVVGLSSSFVESDNVDTFPAQLPLVSWVC